MSNLTYYQKSVNQSVSVTSPDYSSVPRHIIVVFEGYTLGFTITHLLLLLRIITNMSLKCEESYFMC